MATPDETFSGIMDKILTTQPWYRPLSRTATTMRRTIDELAVRHDILFGSMTRRVWPETNIVLSFRAIIDEMCSDASSPPNLN